MKGLLVYFGSNAFNWRVKERILKEIGLNEMFYLYMHISEGTIIMFIEGKESRQC